jgi:hypothetical protein
MFLGRHLAHPVHRHGGVVVDPDDVVAVVVLARLRQEAAGRRGLLVFLDLRDRLVADAGRAWSPMALPSSTGVWLLSLPCGSNTYMRACFLSIRTKAFFLLLRV